MASNEVKQIPYSDLTDVEQIGEGGFGNIYRAKHPQWGNVVYKELKSSFIQDKSKAGDELKNEAKAHVLKHVNIVTLYAMIFELLHYGLVLEFVPNGCLEEFIYTYQIDWPTKLFIAHGVVCGMDYLHSIRPDPVIHGDLKIQNVLVGDGLVAKICDFGLAKWKAYSRTHTQSQSRRAGTVTHTPPEIWNDINHPRTVKYDVYSFAVLLWEFFTEQEPFKHVKPNEQIRLAVCSGQRLDLNVITGPESLVTLVKDWISRCWHQVPNSRPAFTELNKEFMRIHKITEKKSNPCLQQPQAASSEQLEVGKLIHTLPEAEPVGGVTLLAGELYVLRWKSRDQVEVYDIVTYRLQRCLTVPNVVIFTDMTSCEHFLCVYVSDPIDIYIHRLDVGQQGAITQWPVNDVPRGLSVNASHNVIVTCPYVRKIKEFSSHGDLLRELILPGDVTAPRHTIQLTSGQFIVCHGGRDGPIHRVCKMSPDCQHIVQSHGGHWGSGPDQYRWAVRLAVDNNELVFVADANNQRVTLLSPTLNYIRHVVIRDQLKWWPERLYLDEHTHRLYLAEIKWKNGRWTSGRVVVFSV